MDSLRFSDRFRGRGAPPSGPSPRPLLKKLFGPLVVYHVLILFGAFLIVVANGWGTWRFVGIALVVLGISVEISILVWTASLARSASSDSSNPPRGGVSRICVACGRKGSEPMRICPRCGREMVSLGRSE